MDKFEKKYKENLTNKLQDTEPSKELKIRLFQKLGLKNKSETVKSSILSNKWFKICTSFACVVVLFICSLVLLFNNQSSLEYKAVVRIDVNPSIEIIVDDKENVISLKGLNNDGKLILSGENLEGKKLEEVIERIIDIERKTNYLTNSNNKVSISYISENDTVYQDLNKKVNNALNKVKNNLKIDLNIENNSNKTIEDLKEYLTSIDFNISNKSLEDITFDSLIDNLSKYHEEVKELGTIELEKLFYENKYEYIQKCIEEKKEELIDKLDDSYKNIVEDYKSLQIRLKEAYQLIEDTYDKYYVSSESKYQKALKEVEAIKDEIKVLEDTIEKSTNEFEKTLLKAQIETLNIKYETLYETLKINEKIASEAYETVLNSFNALLVEVEKTESKFPDSIRNIKFEDIITNENEEIEFNKNSFDKFINKYDDEIKSINKSLQERKNALLEE